MKAKKALDNPNSLNLRLSLEAQEGLELRWSKEDSVCTASGL